MFDKFGKSILSVIGVNAIMLVVLFAGFIFFAFTNMGVGMVGMANNALKGDLLVPTINEVVMPPNTTINATTDSGTIIIKSGKGLKRYYTWDGATRSVVMWPRSNRWYGSFGIYYPGPGSHWIPNNGISRGVLEEGQQNFDTLEEAETWLKRDCQHCVYNDSGLVVCFFKVSAREQINVDVWQIYIGGKTPSEHKESAFQGAVAPKNKKVEEWRSTYLRNYYIDGKKPAKLKGSNNSAIISSWNNSLPVHK